MKQWYYAAITNVSVHEVWPGHYLQFLYGKQFPSDVRKVFGAAIEHRRLGALLRADGDRRRLPRRRSALPPGADPGRAAARRALHRRHPDAHQGHDREAGRGLLRRPKAISRARWRVSESKRGTSDPTYGYYTMGKLMILKLRDDYKAKLGAQYSLQSFHDAFIGLGPLPLPLIRKAMLGEAGQLFRAALLSHGSHGQHGLMALIRTSLHFYQVTDTAAPRTPRPTTGETRAWRRPPRS